MVDDRKATSLTDLLMRRTWPRTNGVIVRGREFRQQDLVLVRRLIRKHPSWGRTRLSEAVCQVLGWRQPNGRLKDRACRVALLKLESLGFLELPPRKLDRGGRPPRIEPRRTLPEPICRMPSTLELLPVESPSDSKHWNALIAHYHYLGLATPVGRLLRYLVRGDGQTMGAISFSEPAWSITPRDNLVRRYGVPKSQFRTYVAANNRFLILPNVQVRNLASRTLAAATKRVTEDWQARFGTELLFLETFVDPRRFEGICYKAANWRLIGSSKGFAKRGRTHSDKKSPKLLFMIGTTYTSQRFLQKELCGVSRRAA